MPTTTWGIFTRSSVSRRMRPPAIAGPCTSNRSWRRPTSIWGSFLPSSTVCPRRSPVTRGPFNCVPTMPRRTFSGPSVGFCRVITNKAGTNTSGDSAGTFKPAIFHFSPGTDGAWRKKRFSSFRSRGSATRSCSPPVSPRSWRRLRGASSNATPGWCLYSPGRFRWPTWSPNPSQWQTPPRMESTCKSPPAACRASCAARRRRFPIGCATWRPRLCAAPAGEIVTRSSAMD